MTTLKTSGNTREAKDLLEPQSPFKDRIKVTHFPRYDTLGNSSFIVEELDTVSEAKAELPYSGTKHDLSRIFKAGSVILGFGSPSALWDDAYCAEVLDGSQNGRTVAHIGTGSVYADRSPHRLGIEQADVFLLLNLGPNEKANLHNLARLAEEDGSDLDTRAPVTTARMLDGVGFRAGKDTRLKSLRNDKLLQLVIKKGLTLHGRGIEFLIVSTVKTRIADYVSEMSSKRSKSNAKNGRSFSFNTKARKLREMERVKMLWKNQYDQAPVLLPECYKAKESKHQNAQSASLEVEVSGPPSGRRKFFKDVKLNPYHGIYTWRFAEEKSQLVQTLFPADLTRYGGGLDAVGKLTKKNVLADPHADGIKFNRFFKPKQSREQREIWLKKALARKERVTLKLDGLQELIVPGRQYHFVLTSNTLSVAPARKGFTVASALGTFIGLATGSGYHEKAKAAGTMEAMGLKASSAAAQLGDRLQLTFELMLGMPGVPEVQWSPWSQINQRDGPSAMRQHCKAFRKVLKQLFPKLSEVHWTEPMQSDARLWFTPFWNS